jgi:hypothetical protein
MATWKEDYSAALEARDTTEKANFEIYQACSQYSPLRLPRLTQL